MRPLFSHSALRCLFVICLLPGVNGWASAKAEPGANGILISTMQQELKRARTELGKLDPAPYFLSYSVHDRRTAMAAATNGSLISSVAARSRDADVVMRIGKATLDNSHGAYRYSAISSARLPLEDDPDATARVLWQLTYGEYRKAQAGKATP